jgi:RNA polymerase sigma factor (sigma-70 family)
LLFLSKTLSFALKSPHFTPFSPPTDSFLNRLQSMLDNKHHYDDESALVQALKNRETAAFESVYRQYYKMTAAFVRQNNGSQDDAQDVFQEALIILIKNLNKVDFVLKVKVSTFLQAIVRKYWLYKLRDRKTASVEVEDLHNDTRWSETEAVLGNENAFDVKHAVIATVFQQIKGDCRTLLEGFYFHKKPLGELATDMGWTADFVKVKKKRCMNSMRELVQQNEQYQSLINV